MPMTFEEYIQNPMGKGNAVMPAIIREGIRKTYMTKFNNILLRENGEIHYYLYKNPAANTYYILIKIPSEQISNFYYDTIIKFYADEKVKENGRNLEKYYVQFFSNDPAFVYNYAYAFNQNDLFIKELAPRMSKIALKTPAKEKNPQNINGYVKSIYFAYLFMKQRGLFLKSRFDAGQVYDLKLILKEIESADSKIERRQIEEQKRDKRKKIVVDKKTAKNISNITSRDMGSRLVTTTTKVKGVSKTKAVNSVKNSKSTRHSKRI